MPKDTAPQIPTYQSNKLGDRYLEDIISLETAKQSYQMRWQGRYGSLNLSAENLYVFTGTDSGLLIREFAKLATESPIAAIFVEDEQYIDAVRGEYGADIEKLTHAQICTVSELEDQLESAVHDGVIMAGRIKGIQSQCAQDNKLGSYQQINDRIHYLIEFRRWLVLNSSDRLPFLQQQLLNISEMKFSAGKLRGRLKGQTLVLLAAGPSLDDHIDWVIKNRSNIIVVCVSRISKRLFNVGITPDFVVLLDPHPISFEVSRTSLSFTPAPILAFSNQGVNNIVGQWNGPKTYLGTRLPWKLSKNEVVSASTTVSNLAFAFACLLSPENIILIGLDFCLSKAGHTHAKGNMERETGILLRTDMEEVITYDGSTHLSSADYYKSGKQLEEQINDFATDIRVINPSAGAMRLNDVDYIPLAQVKLKTSNALKLVSEIRYEIETRMQSQKWPLKARKEITRFRKKLRDVKKLSEAAISIVNRAKHQPEKLQIHLEKLNVIDHKIKTTYGEQRNFFTQSCGKFFAQILDTGVYEGRDLHEQSLNKSKQIYRAYLNSIEELHKPVEEAQAILQFELLSDQATWPSSLVKHFLNIGLPGRILNTDKILPTGAIETALEAQKQQNRMRSETLQTGLDARKVSGNSLFQVLNGAYTQRSIDKLIHFRNAISQMKDFEHNVIYGALAEAYLAEVLGDNEAAMNHYQRIIDEGETPLMEESLNRVAYLCIRTGDADTALMALTVLSEINPMYVATLEQFRKVA